MRKITMRERFAMRILKTHWFCVACGDFHRYDSIDVCPNELIKLANIPTKGKKDDNS